VASILSRLNSGPAQLSYTKALERVFTLNEKKQSMFKRVTGSARNGTNFLFQGLIICVVGFFVVANCVKDIKGFLSFTGITPQAAKKEVKFRQLDAKMETDKRLAISLAKLAEAGGMDLKKIQVAIAVSPHINAMTVGQDTFVLCEGLTKLSDEALDAVMAHEVAHAIRDHSGRSTEFTNNVGTATDILGTLLGQDEDTKAEAKSWAVDVAFAPYSRGQELEADVDGVELLKKAGYPHNAVEVMTRALDTISKEESSSVGGFLSTHPAISDRIKELRANATNVTGPLTKEQYWAAADTLLNQWIAGAVFPKNIEDEVKTKGKTAALNDLAVTAQKLLNRAENFTEKATAIIPPAEYSRLHKQFISLFSDNRPIVKKQLMAAKAHNLEDVLATFSESREYVDRSADFLKEFVAARQKH